MFNRRQVFVFRNLRGLHAKPAAVLMAERDFSLSGFLISPSLVGQQDGWAEMHLFSPTQGTALHLETRFHSHDAGIVSRPLRHIFLCQTGWLLQQTVFIMQCNALKPCHHCYTCMAFRIIYPLMPCSADRNGEFFSDKEFDRIWHMRLCNIQKRQCAKWWKSSNAFTLLLQNSIGLIFIA